MAAEIEFLPLLKTWLLHTNNVNAFAESIGKFTHFRKVIFKAINSRSKANNISIPGAGILPWSAESPGNRSFELEENGDCLNVSSEKKGLGVGEEE